LEEEPFDDRLLTHGTIYPAVGAAIPEPSTLLLLATAAIALAWLRVKIYVSVT